MKSQHLLAVIALAVLVGGTLFIHNNRSNLFTNSQTAAVNSEVANELDSDRDLIARWDFEEGSGTTAGDSSGHANIGTLHAATGSGPTWSTDKKVGNYALSFNNAQGTYVSTEKEIGGNHEDMTFSAWVKPNDLTGTSGHNVYLNGIKANHNFDVLSNGDFNYLSVDNVNHLYAGAGLSTDTWYMLTVTCNDHSGTMTMYINAQQVKQDVNYLHCYNNISQSFYVSGGSYGWTGLIDDVRIYTRDLSSFEVKSLYCAVETTSPSCDILANGGDDVAPTLNNKTPSSFTPGTTQVTLNLSTDEPATCRYGTDASTGATDALKYASLPNTFNGEGTMTHTSLIANLSDGTTYTYYIRCQDARPYPNIAQSDTVVTFTVRSPITVSGDFKKIDAGGGTLLDLPGDALYSGLVNFRPGDGTVAEVNPPRFSWRYSSIVTQTGALAAGSPYKFAFQIDTDRNFSHIAVVNNYALTDKPTITRDSSGEVQSISVVTLSNSYNFLPPLAKNKTYYWKVGYILPKNLMPADMTESELMKNTYPATAKTPRFDIKEWKIREDSWSAGPYKWSATRNFFVPSGAPEWDRSMLGDTSWMIQRLSQRPNILVNNAAGSLATRDDLYLGMVGNYYHNQSWGVLKRDAQATIDSTWWKNATATYGQGGAIASTLFVYQLASSAHATDAEKKLAKDIRDSHPGAVVASMAKDFVAQGTVTICRDYQTIPELITVQNALAYTYDWLYDDLTPDATDGTPGEKTIIRKAIESRLLAIMYSGGYIYNRYDYSSTAICDKSDPDVAYPWGMKMGAESIFMAGDSHGLLAINSGFSLALACYSDSPICRQFWEIGGNYMIGVTYPFGFEGAPNAGTGYSVLHLAVHKGSIIRGHMLASIALPEAHFERNPFWKKAANYWDKIAPVGLTTWSDQWTDYGGGDVGGINVWGGGGWFARYMKDPIYTTHVINDTLRSSTVDKDAEGGVAQDFEYIPLWLAFPRPSLPTTHTTDTHEVIKSDGYALGCSLPQSSPDCFSKGIGYVIQARPRSIGRGGHAAFSDLSYDFWAYGTTITAGSGASESSQTDVPWLYHPMQRNTILVDGRGQHPPVNATKPYYNRIFACQGAKGCAASKGNYVYVAVDGTNGYPTGPDIMIDLWNGFMLDANHGVAAYKGAPLAGLKKVNRHFLIVKDKYFVIYDDLESEAPFKFSWLYHILRPEFNLCSPAGTTIGCDPTKPSYLEDDPSTFGLNRADGSFWYKSNVKKFRLGFNNYSDTRTGELFHFWRGGHAYNPWANDAFTPSPDVKVVVKQIQDSATFDIDNRMGRDRQINPFTLEQFNDPTAAGLREDMKYGSGLPEGQDVRSNALWFNTKDRKTKYHFMTVIYPKNPDDNKTCDDAVPDPTQCKSDPQIIGLDDYTAKVVNPDGTTDIISFNPAGAPASSPTGENIFVDLEDLEPLLVSDSGYSVSSVTNSYELRVTVDGDGSITSALPAGINCGSSCSVTVTSPATYTLTATPKNGTTFAGWSGACTNSSGPCSVIVNSNKFVTATFTGGTVTPPTNGLCSTTLDQCSLGTFSDTTDTSTNHLWSCLGSNNGTNASCTLPIGTPVTPDITSPNITSVTHDTITTSSAHISWSTNEPAYSQVEYGLTAPVNGIGGYGSKTASTSLTQAPSFTLSLPSASTTYHYRVWSRDSAGNTSISDDGHFDTLPVTPPTGTTTPPTTPPVTPPTTGGGSSGSSGSSGGGSSGGGSTASTGWTGTGITPANVIGTGHITIGAPKAGGVLPTTGGITITRTLQLGSTGADVKALQVFLNNHPSTSSGQATYPFRVASTGTGSPGKESTYFGPATQTALRKYQCAKAIVCSGTATTNGYGATGPKTRAVLKGSGVATPVVPVTTPVRSVVPTPVGSFTRTLQLGSTGADVKALQVFLNQKGYYIVSPASAKATAGEAGSPGYESTYFGPATKVALIKFQVANKITPASGIFGPVTRARVGAMR